MQVQQTTNEEFREFKITDISVEDLIEFLRQEITPFAIHFGEASPHVYVLQTPDDVCAFTDGLNEGARLARQQATQPRTN